MSAKDRWFTTSSTNVTFLFTLVALILLCSRWDTNQDLSGPGGSDIFLRTATKLEGPWTADIKVFHATPIENGLVYAGVAHPYLDPSGQTLVVSFTNNNRIQVVKISFSK
jgi:hypothetical protein